MKLILACTPSGGIGYKGGLPWKNIPGDLKRFKELTTGQVVIMGRSTWESLPPTHRPLPNRTNIVVSSTPIEGCTTVSIDEAKTYTGAWVIGGAKLAMGLIDSIYEVHLTVTTVQHEYDTQIDLDLIESQFHITSCTTIEPSIDPVTGLMHAGHRYYVMKRE